MRTEAESLAQLQGEERDRLLNQCASCRPVGPEATCNACPKNPWEEYATSDDGLREYRDAELAQLQARNQELETELSAEADKAIAYAQEALSLQGRNQELEDALRGLIQMRFEACDDSGAWEQADAALADIWLRLLRKGT